MNGIEELRLTLDRHAADVVDHDLGGRVGSVHQRVRAVRRRRRAAAAGTAALTLAVIGGVALLPERGERSAPAPASVVGLPVPTSMSSLGYTYEFQEGIEGDGRVTATLPASDRPRLVSWGTAGDDDRVRITRSQESTTYDVADFSDYVRLSAGDETSVTVAGSGRIGLAVYELTGDAPEGVTAGGVTYREVVAGQRLLGAEIGEPGQAEVTVAATATSDVVSYEPFCSGAPRGAMIHVESASTEGEVIIGGCEEALPFDPGGAGGFGLPARRGEDVTARMWVTQGADGPVLDSDRVVVGLGVYDGPATEMTAGFDVPTLVEYDGHLWRTARVALSDPGDSRLEVAGQQSARPVLAYGFHPGGATVVSEHSATGDVARFQGADGGNASIGLLSGPGDVASLRVVGEVPVAARLAIVIYERVD